MAKRKPFNLVNNHEYKDTLVWETVLDIVAGSTGNKFDEVVLISNDANAFGAEKDKRVAKLHPELQEDIESIPNGKIFHYHNSFADFLATHSERISEIDIDSITLFIVDNKFDFASDLRKWIINNKDSVDSVVKINNPMYDIDVNLTDFEIDIHSIAEIEDFYVYFRDDNSKLASGSVLITFFLPVYYSSEHFGIDDSYPLFATFKVKLNAEYVGDELKSLKIEDANLQIDNYSILPSIDEALRSRK